MTSETTKKIYRFIDIGFSDYNDVYAQQKHLVTERLANTISDTILMVEHPPVITTGRGTKPENILLPADSSVEVVPIERGGDVTYHGPGQLVVYPIRKLVGGERDLHRYLRNLEAVVIHTLKPFGIEGHRKAGFTGVWVQQAGKPDQKIASIGVAVTRWVTYHGIALNVNTDLKAFQTIHPCGLPGDVMTTMAAVLGKPVNMTAVKTSFQQAFLKVF